MAAFRPTTARGLLSQIYLLGKQLGIYSTVIASSCCDSTCIHCYLAAYTNSDPAPLPARVRK